MRRRSTSSFAARLLALAILLLVLPLPAPNAAAFNTGQAIEQFFECTDINWQNCATGNLQNSVSTTKTGQSNNEEPSRYGFKFPAKAVAASGDFDIHSDYGYRNRAFIENSQGQWNQPGVNATNVTSLFGLRLDLDGSPPNGPNGVSPFFAPGTTNASTSFATGAFAFDTAAGDFDNDGDDDIAVAAGTTVQIRRFSGGNWLNFTSYSLGSSGALGIEAADLNKDGRMDAVVYNATGSTAIIWALMQLPWGGMRLEGPMTVNSGGVPAANDFDVGDLTGDGKPDVAVVYQNRTIYWMDQGGSNNLDFWGANTYSIKLQSLLYANNPTQAASAPSPCNATVATTTLDGKVYVYWQNNFTLITTLTAHANAVNGLAWAPNCNYLATASSDQTILVWRTSNWTVAANLTGHTNQAYSVAFSPDSNRLASGAADSHVIVWNLTSFPPAIDYNITESDGTIYALAFSPNNSYLVVGTGNNNVRVRTTADFSLVTTLTGHTFAARTLAFAPNGTELASGSLDDKVRIWNMDTLSLTGVLSQASADINQVAYAPNGTRFLAAASDGHVRQYRTSDWTVMDDIVEGSSFIYATAYDRLGENVITGGTTNYLRLWDRSTLVSNGRTYTGQEFSALSVAYSRDGRLAIAAEDGTVAIYQLSNSTIVARFRAHDGAVNRVVWSPGSNLLATAGTDGMIHVFDTSTWAYSANITLGGNITGLDFSDVGGVLAASNVTGGIGAWLIPANTTINTMASVAGINALALDPTGSNLVVAGTDGLIRVFNISGRWNFQNLTAAAGINQRAVDWSPDGTLIASGGGGSDRRARTWWTSNWTLNSNVLTHSNEITTLAFAPDSSRFATGGWDQRIFVFNRTGATVQQYPSAPAGATLILSLAWAPDAQSLAVGWHAIRFPHTNQNLCGALCGANINTKAIAIGQADGVAGNDIVIAGNYQGFQADSMVARLSFTSGGVPGSFSAITALNGNAVADAFRIDLGDLTGDGKNDIAVGAETQGGVGTVYIIAWDSTTSSFDSLNIVNLPTGGSINEVQIADVTDDGHNDVVIAAGFGSNQVQVAYYESTARQTGQLRFANTSKLLGVVSGDAPMGIAIGNFNNDTLPDVAAANGAAFNVQIWLQKDQLYGTFISQALTDAVFVGDPVVSAKIWWDDWNVIPGVTAFNVSFTLNNGFTWIPVQENVSLDLNGSNSTTMKYRVDFWSDRAAITAWVLAVELDYVVRTTPNDLSMDILRDFQPSVGECFWPGVALGDFHCSFAGSVINQYVLDNWNLQDENGSIYMPIRIRFTRPGTVTLSNLSIPYNRDPSPPEQLVPSPNTFVDATPTFVVRASDSDSDNLRYHVQVATDPTFLQVVRSFNQNDTSLGWGLPFYTAGSNATVTTPDAQRLNNGQSYYWRVAAYDGLQWSDWSTTEVFTVDDLPPDGFATSPPYSTTETFTVSWSSIDPPGGAGLGAAPYDVQFEDGINGAWTDLVTSSALTSTNFVGQNGHTYCFHMRATDAAGNPQLFSVGAGGDTCTVIDTDRPSASISDLPPFETTRNFEVSWSGSDGVGGSGVGGYDIEFQPEGGSWTSWLTGYGSTSAIYTAADDRTFTFRVAARDRAGNLGPVSATAATRVDTTPPVCQVTLASATITNLDRIQITMACSDPQTGVAAYEYCVGSGPTLCDEAAPARSTIAVPLITDLTLANGGTYYVSVHALNVAGGWSGWTASPPVRVVIPGPAAHIEYESGVWTSTDINLTFGASDALGYTVVAGELQFRRAAFRYNQLGTWEDWLTVIVDAGASGYAFTGDDIYRGYAYEFRYRARNEVGSWGDYAAGDTVYVNQLPVASAGGDRIANISQEIVLDGTSSLDYDGERDTLTYQWETDTGEVIPPGTTATVRFTTAGTHVATLTVSDGHETSTAVVHIQVKPDAPKQILPGFEAPFMLLALLAVAFIVGTRRRQRAQ